MPELEHDWLWVPCTTCGALVGMDCVTILGVPRDGPHGQRWDLYLAACCGAVPDPEHQAPAMTPRMRGLFLTDLTPWQHEKLRAAGLAPASPPAAIEVPRDTLAALPATTARPWSREELTRFAGDFARGHGFAIDQVLVQLPGAEHAVPYADALATFIPPCAREGDHSVPPLPAATTDHLARIAALLREDTA